MAATCMPHHGCCRCSTVCFIAMLLQAPKPGPSAGCGRRLQWPKRRPHHLETGPRLTTSQERLQGVFVDAHLPGRVCNIDSACSQAKACRAETAMVKQHAVSILQRTRIRFWATTQHSDRPLRIRPKEAVSTKALEKNPT